MIHGSLLHLSFHHCVRKLYAWLRSDIGRDTDNAVGTFLHERICLVIITAENKESLRTSLDDFQNLSTVARGLLYRYYIINLRQSQSSLRSHIRTCPAWYVI